MRDIKTEVYMYIGLEDARMQNALDEVIDQLIEQGYTTKESLSERVLQVMGKL